MLKKEEKKFYADTAWGASKLSECRLKQGTVLIKGKFILAYGYNKKIIKNKDYEISAIYEVIFSARELCLDDTILFSTYFPSLDDMKLILSCGICSIYFFGEIKDPHSVEIMNRASQEGISLKMTHLI